MEPFSSLLESGWRATEVTKGQTKSDSPEAEGTNLAEFETTLEDVSDPLHRLSMLLDIRDILNDMIWFYNEFPKFGNSQQLDTSGDAMTGDESQASREIQTMDRLLEAMFPSLSYVLSSLSLTRRSSASTGITPIVFKRKIDPMNVIQSTGDPPSAIRSINERISQANESLFSIEGYLHPRSSADLDQGEAIQEEFDLLRKNFIEDVPLWNITKTFKSDNVSFLLFEEEKVRMEAILDAGLDPRMHWGSIAAPFSYVSEEEETAAFQAIKIGDLLPICLKATDFYQKIAEPPTKWKFVGKFKAYIYLKDIAFYIMNVATDMNTGFNYLWRKEYLFGLLTLLCLVLPIFAEVVSKFILKALGWGKKFGIRRWKDVLPYDFFSVLPRMVRNLVYKHKANATYKGMGNAYSELHYCRCIKGQMKFKADALRYDSNRIQDLCFAFSTCHEILIDQSLLTECLYEDAPQLLIQMTAVALNKWRWSTFSSIAISLATFSFALHKAHKNIHRSSAAAIWKDDFSALAAIFETLGYLLVYGTRFTSISVIFIIIPVWFTMGACTYLVLLYCLLTFVSGRSDHYRKLHGFKTTAFWPLTRLFTMPHTVGVWRLDSLDHLLFYLETVFMGAFIPYVFTDNELPWFIKQIYIVISCAFLSAIILFVFKKTAHVPNPLCEKLDKKTLPTDPKKMYIELKDFI